jgi:elongation factor P
MALVGANELKRKMLISVEGHPYTVLEVFFASPTARGAATMVRTRLRQLLTGAVLEKSFKATEKFAEPDVQYVPASFLYSDGEGFHFMDESSYEQFMFTGEQVGDDQGYLKEGVSLQILKVQRRARLAATAAVRRTRRDRNRTRHARRYGRGRREQKRPNSKPA